MMQREEGDAELMLRVREDDSAALSELMRRYRERLLGFFFNLSRDADLAEDLLQETFIRLWQARARYRPTARFSTYLIHIARNLWLNERPRWKRRQEVRSLDETGGGSPDGSDRPNVLETVLADLRELPEEVLLEKERMRQIVKAIGALPPALALTLTLYHLKGYTSREVATMLDIPEGTVKWRVSEALRRLREELRRKMGDC